MVHTGLFITLGVAFVIVVGLAIGLPLQRNAYLKRNTIQPCLVQNKTDLFYRHCEPTQCTCNECGISNLFTYEKMHIDCTNASYVTDMAPCCSDHQCTVSVCHKRAKPGRPFLQPGRPISCSSTVTTHHKLCKADCRMYHDVIVIVKTSTVIGTIHLACNDGPDCGANYAIGEIYSCIQGSGSIKFGDKIKLDAGSISILVLWSIATACFIILSAVVIHSAFKTGCCQISSRQSFSSSFGQTEEMTPV